MKIFTAGGGWGDHIGWFPDFKSRRVVGWKTPRPQVGDQLHVAMQSGRTLICRFTSVELKTDPEDMFFATVEDVGYADAV